ncbi:hypothetical protein Tco_0800595 [Tanacetum coccineum]|uniref:Reverse transcriptase domain-containing protein n=1 Tax=Tanacetum coccineum TaxID=301880 RepID=A0ABQ4ZXN3_9ASTR
MDEFRSGKITISVKWDHRKARSEENSSKQTIAIGFTLTEEGRKGLCELLKRNQEIFTCKPKDMTGVLRYLAKHRLNVREGCLPVRQKKRIQAPERNKEIQEEVGKLVDTGIMKEVYYHSWLSDPIMVKEHDNNWQMRARNINDVYERIMARMDERLDQFVDQLSNRMNDMMNLRRCGDRSGRRSEDEELGNPFFKGDCSSSNEWGDYGVAGDDYEGAPVFGDDYEEAPVFDDDQFEEESMPVYDTDIEDVIGEEEKNMEDIIVVANDLCSSMIQTTLSVDFSKTIDSNPHELI